MLNFLNLIVIYLIFFFYARIFIPKFSLFFYYNVHIFEDFCLILVKKNRQNEKRRKMSGYLQQKPSRDWLEKDQWETVIRTQSLNCSRFFFFLSAEDGLRRFDKTSFKSRLIERRRALGKNGKSTVIIMLSTDRILKRWSILAESVAKNWVLIVWVEDLHRRTGNKGFWEEEQEGIDLATFCLIRSFTFWVVGPTYRLS